MIQRFAWEPAAPCASRRTPAPSRAALQAIMALTLAVGVVAATPSPGAAESGDFLCDPVQSNSITCVITGTQSVPDDSELRFDRPNVRVRDALEVETTGHCELSEGTSCESDGDCIELGPCVRTRRVAFVVDGLLTVEGRIQARGEAESGDQIGPDGGTISLTAQDIEIVGLVSVSAKGRPGVDAGNGGTLRLNARGEVRIGNAGTLEASTSTGACGGSIVVGDTATPRTLELLGDATVEAATFGGIIHLTATERATIGGKLDASNNNNGGIANRPICNDGEGGGRIEAQAARIELGGRAKSRGKEADGGRVILIADRDLTVDSTNPVAIDVAGGDQDAFSIGGEVTLTTTAGDIALRRGRIEADGQTFGFGSDGGAFDIVARRGMRCAESGAACTSDTDCALGERCYEVGGDVLIEVGISARGGAGEGFGCFLCEISGARNVIVAGGVDVSGGSSGGTGGDLEILAGGDLVVGPGPIRANGADGGQITLLAGASPGTVPHDPGTLRISTGTRIETDGSGVDGTGGDLDLEGCDVTVEAEAELSVAGGQEFGLGLLFVTAREELRVGAGAAFDARPDGDIQLVYRVGVTIAEDATFEPDVVEEHDPSLPICAICGNGLTESPEACDTPGSCPELGDVCVRPGSRLQCSCIDTCASVPGVQDGEECDGTDFSGKSCITEGFSGGTLDCRADCTLDTSECFPAVCGDGTVGPDEECDDGNRTPGDCCDATCTQEADDSACDDGNRCTAGEGCVAGECGGGEEMDCSALDDQCHVGVCDPATGACRAEPLVDGTPCDDGDACTADEACFAGECGAGDATDCSGLDDQCNFGVCDASTGLCETQPVVDGTECRDEDPCTTGDMCTGGECGSGPAVDCTTLNDQCNVGVCNAAAGGVCQIQPVADGEPCDDGNRCTQVDTCRVGACVGGMPVVCAAPDQCHDVGVCDAATGECRSPAKPDGSVCSDGDACTTADACVGGSCAGGASLECDDGSVCTQDSCDPERGCVRAPVADCCAADADCDDGDACTGAEACDVATGVCLFGTAPACDDADVCTMDTCMPLRGCLHEPMAFSAVAEAVQEGEAIDACAGANLARIRRLLGRARHLVDRAEGTQKRRVRKRRLNRAARILNRAGKLTDKATGKRATAACTEALGSAIEEARARTLCLSSANGNS